MIGAFIGAPIGADIASGDTGVLAVTLDDVNLVSAGALSIAASASITLDDVALITTGTITLSGAASIVLDGADLVATGDLEIHGIEGALLDDVRIIATAHVAAVVLSRIRSGGYMNTPCHDGHGLTRLRASGGRR